MAIRSFGESEEIFIGSFRGFHGELESKMGLGATHFREDWPHERPPSLLELIGGWLVYGEATDECGSYDMFLLAVFVITDAWTRGDFREWPKDGNPRHQTIDVYCVHDKLHTFPQAEWVLTQDIFNRNAWDSIVAQKAYWRSPAEEEDRRPD